VYFQGLQDERVAVLAAVVSEQYDMNKDAIWALKFASNRLRNDLNVVLAAVTKYGMCLEHASLEMRAHREIVLVSVESSGDSLQFASDELRDTKVRIWLTLSPLLSFSIFYGCPSIYLVLFLSCFYGRTSSWWHALRTAWRFVSRVFGSAKIKKCCLWQWPGTVRSTEYCLPYSRIHSNRFLITQALRYNTPPGIILA
jgi:hypothetical protein